jgi:hypothetical protein
MKSQLIIEIGTRPVAAHEKESSLLKTNLGLDRFAQGLFALLIGKIEGLESSLPRFD